MTENKHIHPLRFNAIVTKNKELKQHISELKKENVELKKQIRILEQRLLKFKAAGQVGTLS